MRTLNEIRERVADGHESASSRNVITVAALTLKDLHYVLSSHDGQFARGATAMRDKCVEAVEAASKQLVCTCIGERSDHHVRCPVLIGAAMVVALESLTLDQVQEKR